MYVCMYVCIYVRMYVDKSVVVFRQKKENASATMIQ